MAASSSHGPVHKLWSPSGGEKRTELDVVLFHGLQLTAKDSSDAWSSTWTQRGDDNVCWPREWLPYDLREAVRISSVSYNANVLDTPHEDVSHIAHNLFQDLMHAGYEWHHPIVLIGHSFGGLVLKSLVVKLKGASTVGNPTNSLSEATVQFAKVFLGNVRGVVFYAVPHAGGGNIAKFVNKLFKCHNRQRRGIMDNIQDWNRDMGDLSVDFDLIVNENKINIYAFCEGRPTNVGKLVTVASAQQLARANYYVVDDANHMEVCKPPSKGHSSYRLLLQFIITCGKPLQEVHDLPQSMFGLESYVGRVETLVTSEKNDADAHYVGVCGMGGVGKTFLLRRVDGSPKVKGHFRGAEFIWLTVGQTPDIMALYRTLSKKLHLDPELHANPEDYKHYLCPQFIQKRVFLVLDDVWQEEAFDSLDLAKGKGSVTLFSTRNQSLLERSSPQIRQEHMIPLSKDDSWSLFCVHAFRPPSNVPSELKALAQSMAEQCQGLPLALKVIGSAMYGKTSPGLEWEPLLKMLRESRMQGRTVEQKLYERLKLGYDLLFEEDWRLANCFLYFAAFPEDSMIDFHEILWHWIGEGLVPGHAGDDPRADAFALLKTLCKRSFIESDEWYVLDEGFVIDEEYFLTFKIHDVMRDLAFYILRNDSGTPPAKQLYLYRAGQNLEEIPQEWKAKSEALRLSLKSNNFTNFPHSFYAPKLTSLLLGKNPIQFIPINILSNFPKLKVLDLSHGEFDSLPDALAGLQDLVCLDLSYCRNLKWLPETVVQLLKLKCLVLRSCTRLKYLPSGVAKLTSLQVLHTIYCVKLTWVEHRPSDMAESSGHAVPTIRASLEDICELVVLTQLSICGKKDPQLRREVLPLEMSSCFKQLQELDIWGFENLDYLPNSFTEHGAFPALIKFGLRGCEKLVKFPDVYEGALPKLRRLDFSACISLESLPLSLQFLTSLRELIVSECEDTLKDCCRTNCENSQIWSGFDIQDELGIL